MRMRPAPLGYRMSGRYVMHSTNAAGRYLFNAYPIYLLYLPLIFLWRLACPSLASGLVDSWSSGASKTRVCPYLACCPARSAGDTMITLHGRCSSLTTTAFVVRNAFFALIPYLRLILSDSS